MTVAYRVTVDERSGGLGSAGLRLLSGRVTLVAGVATEVLSDADAQGIPDDAPVLVTPHTAGGTEGVPAAVYDLATKTITITSSQATDTSIVNWFVFTPTRG